MSQLIVVTDPERATGFLLAGVQAFGASDAEAAQSLIRDLYEQGETGLIALDEDLVASMDPSFLDWLTGLDDLYHLEIPIPGPETEEHARRERYLERLRETIGFRIRFEGEEAEPT